MAKKKHKKQSGGGQQFLSEDNYIKQRLRGVEIGPCYMSDELFSRGEGVVIVSRLHKGGRVSYASFLVDVWCVGVKDSFYRLREEDYEFDENMKDFQLMKCSYEEAHNVIYGAVSFAEEVGINPDKSFLLTRYFLEEDTEDVPLIDYEFGKEGQYFLVCKSNLEASRYFPHLREHLGDDGFQMIIDSKSSMFDDDAYDDEYYDDEYDDDDLEEGIDDDGPMTIMSVLRDFSKDEVLRLADMMGIKIDPSLPVEEVRRRYREEVLAYPKEVLCALSEEDIRLLRDLQDSDSEDYVIHFFDITHRTLLETFGFATVGMNDETEGLFVAKDFAQTMLPLLDELMEDETFKVVHLLECYIEGVANLYGMVSLEYVKDCLKRFLQDEGTFIQKLLDASMISSLALKTMYYCPPKEEKSEGDSAKDGGFFISRLYKGEYEKLFHLLMSKEVTERDYRQFTDDEILRASTVNQTQIPNAYQKEFDQFLRKNGQNEYDSLFICQIMWVLAMNETEAEVKNFFENLLWIREIKKGSTFKDNEVRQILEEYLDNMPRWTLRGHSPKEIR